MPFLRLFIVVAVAGAGLTMLPALPGTAPSQACAAEDPMVGGLALPNPPKGNAAQCVAPTEYMRKYHGFELYRQRDLTVRNGIRTKQFSLVGCIECHAVKGDDGKPVSYESPKNFCRVCHDFSAVRIDCFECHNSVPDTKRAAIPGAPHGSRRLASLSGINWGAAR